MKSTSTKKPAPSPKKPDPRNAKPGATKGGPARPVPTPDKKAAKSGASKAGPALPAHGAVSSKPAGNASAKTDGLAKVEALLGRTKAAIVDAAPVGAEPTRFERIIQRVEKGEAGPIRIAELTIDANTVKAARDQGLIESYKKILRSNPSAQPGRPLVNVVGSSDKDLSFQLLSLTELVLAAKELGRDIVQVSLVRLSAVEAADLLARPAPAPAAAPKKMTALEIAGVNGFMEIDLAAIARTENLRQAIHAESPEFLNLVESIREIGLQNPPVVEVRARANREPELVCVSGHRRLLALETIGHEKVTCALKTFRSEKHRALAGLAENINREDLHFLDKADAYAALVGYGMTANEIAALLDSDSRTVGKYVRAGEWDQSVKKRIREMGSKATTRFLLNMLAAGERTTAELHGILDRFLREGGAPASSKPKALGPAEMKRKLGEFYALSSISVEQRVVVEKALRFLGFMA